MAEIKAGRKLMPGVFELNKAADGQFHFVLKADNGEVILSSELYKEKTGAEAGIASVRANCQTDDRFEKKTSSNGKPYFTLKAGNNEIIGTSQMYASEAARDNGIASVKNNGTTQAVNNNS
jgi:uncharacterized protein YegP (UPF0339 family)